MSQTTRKPEAPILYGPDGEPIDMGKIGRKNMGSGGGFSYINALQSQDAEPLVKAQEPFNVHAYVYSATNAIATNIGQVCFEFYRETEETQAYRAQRALSRGTIKNVAFWVPNYGRKRTAMERYAQNKRRLQGRKVKGLEEDYDYELTQPFRRPNNVLRSQSEMWYALIVLLILRGEGFWIAVKTDGTLWAMGMPVTDIERIILLHPDNMREKLDEKTGEVVYWEYRTNRKDAGLGIGGVTGKAYKFLPEEVIHFKTFNPIYPLRGMSRITASAMGVTQDLYAQMHNTSLLKNHAEPGGVIHTDQGLQDDERKQLLRNWHERHKGPLNRGNVAILEGGVTFTATTLTQKDMEFIEQRRWNREEILAVIGPLPKSILSITDDLNYATQLAQDRNFWNKCAIPLIRLIENTIDGMLLLLEPDTVVGMFDLTKIEALQEEITGKIDNMVKLVTTGRVSRDVAADRVGLDLPPEDGSDAVLVAPNLVPIEEVINGLTAPTPGDPGDPSNQDNPQRTVATIPTISTIERRQVRLIDPRARFLRASNSLFYSRRGISVVSWRAKAARQRSSITEEYFVLVGRQERPVKEQWRTHVSWFRREQMRAWNDFLEAHDLKAAAGAIIRDIGEQDIEGILLDLADPNKRLSARLNPLYHDMVDKVFSLTDKELGGLTVIEVDSDRVTDFISSKLIKVKERNKTIRDRLRKQLVAGIQGGETITELSQRINRVFNNAAGAARATTIARTETAQMMSGSRDIIFDEEGIIKHDWSTAGDEHVREDHVTFGGLGAQKRGFNYMSAVNKPGTLLYPSDVSGPADQVINCRCVATASE